MALTLQGRSLLDPPLSPKPSLPYSPRPHTYTSAHTHKLYDLHMPERSHARLATHRLLQVIQVKTAQLKPGSRLAILAGDLMQEGLTLAQLRHKYTPELHTQDPTQQHKLAASLASVLLS